MTVPEYDERLRLAGDEEAKRFAGFPERTLRNGSIYVIGSSMPVATMLGNGDVIPTAFGRALEQALETSPE